MIKFRIPNCLTLDEVQRAALSEFGKSLPDLSEEDVDCCGTGHTFQVTGSGVGDSISVTSHGRKFNIGYDDDGEILGEISL